MLDDYIKRSDAIDALYQARDKMGVVVYRVNCIEKIEEIPAADVADVKHGRWEYDSDGVPCCAACGEPALQRLHMYMKIRSFSAPFVRSKICPNCGAKMQGEEYDTE